MKKSDADGNTGKTLRETDGTRKKCNFPDFSTELLISKIITSINNKKIRDKLLKEKDLNMPKIVKQSQQNTCDKKNKKTKPETLISNQGKEIKTEPIYKITYT